MTRLKTLLPVCLAMLLAGCGISARTVTAQLPAVPSDIAACFVGVTPVPDRDLTIADVERLWKDDRRRAAAMSRCGTRLVNWYTELRASWT